MDRSSEESGDRSGQETESEEGLVEASEIEEKEPESVIEYIEAIVKDNIWGDINTKDRLSLFLQSWWSKHYNKPLKDPILQTYTIEELLYEYYDKIERVKYEKYLSEKVEHDSEQAKLDSTMKWADEEEKKEEESMKEWMDKKLQEEKEKYGESFGEDLVLNDLDSSEVE